MRRLTPASLHLGFALAAIGATPEETAMLETFDEALTAMAFAGAGLCVFAIVWAGFVLMAEGSEERGGGRARNAVLGAVLGLVIILSAKIATLALLGGIVPIP